MDPLHSQSFYPHQEIKILHDSYFNNSICADIDIFLIAWSNTFSLVEIIFVFSCFCSCCRCCHSCSRNFCFSPHRLGKKSRIKWLWRLRRLWLLRWKMWMKKISGLRKYKRGKTIYCYFLLFEQEIMKLFTSWPLSGCRRWIFALSACLISSVMKNSNNLVWLDNLLHGLWSNRIVEYTNISIILVNHFNGVELCILWSVRINNNCVSF